LTFGTAGLRGPVGDGPASINRRVVAAVAAGLAAWLQERHPAPSVVIGYDARHQSDEFAREVAEVLAGADVDVSLLPVPTPTPVLAYAVGSLRTSAGVMITASHNPATDNGIKVYLDDTTQIASPNDAAIAARIGQVEDANTLPRSSDYRTLGDEVVESYVQSVAALVKAGPRTLSVAYTPLHGVGADVFLRAATHAGFTGIHPVAEQVLPDPEFPNVPFPNPEEAGAMDRVLDLAEDIRAELVLAHDPDADRCAVAVRSPDTVQVLTGDEVGALLGDHLLRRGHVGTYASSIVSADLVGKLAEAHGSRWQQTLTGFKWIGKVPDLAFGYEEALGYCVAPHLARDKDGISAALMILELAEELKSAGQTLLDRLDELFQAHGYHLTDQISVEVASPDEATELIDMLRTEPSSHLHAIELDAVDDLEDGYRGLPPAEGLRLGFDGGRIFVRPSGTEPKLKCYVEVVDADEVIAQARLDLIVAELLSYFRSATRTGTSR
jgi:phosphomannomutase